MDNAPTKLKARATLSPITTITTVINIDRRTKDSMKDLLAIRLCVQRYTREIIIPKTKANKRLTITEKAFGNCDVADSVNWKDEENVCNSVSIRL